MTSGLRIGTAALASRGMGPDEMRQVGKLILQALAHIGEEAVEREVAEEVGQLTERFPVPGITADMGYPFE